MQDSSLIIVWQARYRTLIDILELNWDQQIIIDKCHQMFFNDFNQNRFLSLEIYRIQSPNRCELQFLCSSFPASLVVVWSIRSKQMLPFYVDQLWFPMLQAMVWKIPMTAFSFKKEFIRFMLTGKMTVHFNLLKNVSSRSTFINITIR